MSTHRHHRHGDTSGSGSASVPRPGPSRERVGSPIITGPESSSSVRGATYPTSHAQSDPATSHSISEAERIDRERDPQKRSTPSLAKDQASVYSKEGEASTKRDEFRPPREEGRHQYHGTDGTKDTPRVTRHQEDVDIHRPSPALGKAKAMQPVIHPSASFQRIFESQSRDLCILQNECRAAGEEKKALTEAYATLRQQYDERYKKLITARQERQAALVQRKEVDDAYMALKDQYDELTQKLDAVRQERQAALEQKQKAEEDYAALLKKYETQKNDHNTLNIKFRSLKAVLEQRTSELQGVQRFLTTADTFSGAEVVSTLRKLNEEVQESMALMAEWSVENFTFEMPSTDQTTEQDIEQTRASETLGVKFMQLLGTKKHKDNPTLIEMALRAYLIYELYWVASPWSIGQEEQSHNLYVDGIYQRIREAEGQAVSGNWRALTRTYTLPACISDPQVAHTFGTTIVAGFSDILLAGGCTASKSDIMSALWSKFEDKVHHFVTLAGQVNKIVGVGVISEDFEVLVIWPDVVFDERSMEDAYDDGVRVQGIDGHEKMVLCATELGLMQRMSIGAGSTRKGKPSELIIIKPKVALVSVADTNE